MSCDCYDLHEPQPTRGKITVDEKGNIYESKCDSKGKYPILGGGISTCPGAVIPVTKEEIAVLVGGVPGPIYNISPDSPVKPFLPEGRQERKDIPVCSGVLDYFPAAIAEVAKVSKAGNDQHNPGEPLHWARGKSMDHADCISRHLMERGTLDMSDPVPMRHSAKLAWRALALLQQEMEDAGAPISRGSK